MEIRLRTVAGICSCWTSRFRARLPFVAILLSALMLSACETTSMGETAVTSMGKTTAVASAPGDKAASSEDPSASTSPADLQSLEELWVKRTESSSSNADYPVGPGDVLSVSVPEIKELQKRTVRVTARGTIELPLVGIVEVGGLTEDGVAKELDHRLEKYMYSPEASVFVNEYRNREAAVVGAVNHPGLVLLDTPSETILDVITKAGGLLNTAADQLILIPAVPGGNPMMGRVSSITRRFDGTNNTKPDDPPAPGQSVAAAPDGVDSSELHASSPTELVDPQRLRPKSNENDFSTSVLQMLPSNARPISISLRSTSLTGAGKYLNLPARPGDVIVVPGGGDVMVVGWVQRPGYFAVGSGLTVMGAIGAAGGPMYAANADEVTLIRSTKNGSKVVLPVNLEKISKGEESDIPVKANDVIDVPYSGLRIGPYIFYSILSRMGIGAPIPAL